MISESDDALLQGKRLKDIACRFLGIVYPGDLLKLKAVRELNKINFEVTSHDKLVLAGYAYL